MISDRQVFVVFVRLRDYVHTALYCGLTPQQVKRAVERHEALIRVKHSRPSIVDRLLIKQYSNEAIQMMTGMHQHYIARLRCFPERDDVKTTPAGRLRVTKEKWRPVVSAKKRNKFRKRRHIKTEQKRNKS